jgi:hypothetical protein
MGNSDSALCEFEKIESNDPKHTKGQMRLTWADEKMDKKEIMDRFLKALSKNDVLTCVHLSTVDMDAICMKCMKTIATAINAKPNIVSLLLDVCQCPPSSLSIFFAELNPAKWEYVQLHFDVPSGDTGDYDDVKVFFAAAKALKCLVFLMRSGVYGGECKFFSAAVAGLEENDRHEEILMKESYQETALAHIRDAHAPMRLINFPDGILSENAWPDHIKSHTVGSLVRLETTVFFHIGKSSCEIIEWMASDGAEAELDKSVVYQAFSRFMKLLTNETKLREIGLHVDCRDPMFGSIVCRYAADMPTLEVIYKRSSYTNFPQPFDMSLWNEGDQKRCAFYLHRNSFACCKVLCSHNTPLSLWPHLLESLDAKTKGGDTLAASLKYYLIREGLTGLMNLMVAPSNEYSNTAESQDDVSSTCKKRAAEEM